MTNPESTAQTGGLLQDRVALVTGGAQGIGFAIAQALSEQGAALMLNDLGCDRAGKGSDPALVEQAAEELRASGARVSTSDADVTDAAAVASMVKQANRELGTVDLLVNNAGIISDRSLFDLEESDWDRVVATHLRGTFLCTREVARSLRRAHTPGSIINVTSVSGMRGNLNQSNESSAKAGIYGLTRTASIELQRFQITVNALCPIARTRMTEDLPMFEKVQGSMEAQHIAPAAVFLASDLADGLSGVVLSVAGGRLSTYELSESQGRVKEADQGVWTPQEIAENYDSIARR